MSNLNAIQTTLNGCQMLDESRERLRAAISSIDNTLAHVKTKGQPYEECDVEHNSNLGEKSKDSLVEWCKVDNANHNGAFVTTPHRFAPLLPEATLATDYCQLSESVNNAVCSEWNKNYVERQSEEWKGQTYQTRSAVELQEWKEELERECVTSDETDKQFGANREREFDHILQLLRVRREMDLFQFHNTRSKQLTLEQEKEFQKLSFVSLPSLTPLNTHHNNLLLPLYNSNTLRSAELCHTSPICSHGVLHELMSNLQCSKLNEESITKEDNNKVQVCFLSSENSKVITHSLESREVLRKAPVLLPQKHIIDTDDIFTRNVDENKTIKPTYKEHIVPAINTNNNTEKSSVSLPDYFSCNLSSQLLDTHSKEREIEEKLCGSSNANVIDMGNMSNANNLLGQTANISATVSMKPTSQLVHMKQYVQEPQNLVSDIVDALEQEEQEHQQHQQQQIIKEVEEMETPLSLPDNIIRVINYEYNPSERSYKLVSNNINKNKITNIQEPHKTQEESNTTKMSSTSNSVNVVNVPDIATMESATAYLQVVSSINEQKNSESKLIRSNEPVHESNISESEEVDSEHNLNDKLKSQNSSEEEMRQYRVISNRQSIQTPEGIASVLYEEDEKAISNQNVVMQDGDANVKEQEEEQVNGSLMQKQSRYNEETDKGAHRMTYARSFSSSVYQASCPSPAPELLYQTEMETHEKHTSAKPIEKEANLTFNNNVQEISEENKKEMEDVNVHHALPNNTSVYNSSTLPSMLSSLPVETAQVIEKNDTKENLNVIVSTNESNNSVEKKETINNANSIVIGAPEVANITTEQEEEEQQQEVDDEVMASVVSCDNIQKNEMIAKQVDEQELLLNEDADEFVAEEENKQALSLSSPESSSLSSIKDKKEELTKDDGVTVQNTKREREHVINVKVAKAAQDHALALLKSTGVRVRIHVYDKCIPALVQISHHNNDLLLYIQRVETLAANDQIAGSLRSTPHLHPPDISAHTTYVTPIHSSSNLVSQQDNKIETLATTMKAASASHLPFVQNTPLQNSTSLLKSRSLFPSALSLSSLPSQAPILPPHSTSLHPLPSIAIPYTTLIETIRERDRDKLREEVVPATQSNQCTNNNNNNNNNNTVSSTDNSVFSSSEHLPAVQSTSSSQHEQQQQQQRSLVTITHPPVLCNGSTLITPLTSMEEVMPIQNYITKHKHHSQNKKMNSHIVHNKVVMNDDSNWCAPSCRTLFNKLHRHLRTPAHFRRHYTLGEDVKASPIPLKSDKLTSNSYVYRERPNEFSAAAHMSAYPLSLPQMHSQTVSTQLLEQSKLTTPKQSKLSLNNNNNTDSNNNVSLTQTVKEVQHFPLMHARVCLPFASYNKSYNDMLSEQSVNSYNNDVYSENDENYVASKHLHVPFLVYTSQSALKLLRSHHCTLFADINSACSTHTKYLLYILFPHYQSTLIHLTDPNETVLLILECKTRLDWVTLLMAMQAAQRSLLHMLHTHRSEQQSELLSETSSSNIECDLQFHDNQVISYGKALWWLASQRLHYQHATRQRQMLHRTEKQQKVTNNKTNAQCMTSKKNAKTTTIGATRQHHHVSSANTLTASLSNNNKKKHSTSTSSNNNNNSGSLSKLKQLLRRKKQK